ncbi:CG13288 [Drosophila busckii]|uniref:CG13288 n=1 Tax=Drosophila busckii TaxID=30019 RepID=A0A0M4EJE2_DROBS|nr:uncharacterized protein LOC108599601 [Drosophila busckii]ALC44126.1 CG13288 [Drosophila busckii]
MAILDSCCFWKNVRKGSFACGIYTLIYFGLSTLMFMFYLKEEKEFLFGQRAQPVGESLLEKGDVTVVTVIFNVLFLFCSLLLVLASLLLLAGLHHNKRQLLLPWICLMCCDLLIECAHLVHLTLSRRVSFDPIVGFIFTIDFFILCLNVYSLLCVISQYQSYCVQRTEQRQQAAQPPTVVYKAPTQLSKGKRKRQQQQQQQKLIAGKPHSRRLLPNSPLNTSQRPTNFSTITEEEEQQQQQQQVNIVPDSHSSALQLMPINGNGNGNGNGIGIYMSEQPTDDAAMNAIVPIITLDPNSLH